MSKNYYELLGIAKNASRDEIKKAFRTLAHKYHPDKKGGDEKKFKEINEAYSVLSDDKKRAEYDSYGRVFSEGAGAGGATGQNPFGGFDFSSFTGSEGFQGFDFDLGDIFGDFFGGGGGRERVKRGRDISIDIEISFSESIFGANRSVLLAKSSICDTCKGSGAEPGTSMETCKICNGKGKIHETKRSFIGAFSTTRVCDACQGRGQAPKEKCHECKGHGVRKREQEIEVKIPAGIDDGEMIRLSGAGEAVSGGVAGDLYVKVHVKRHPFFRKEGNNLVTDLTIKLSTALLGGQYSLSTLEGDIALTIPEGISFGEILRIKGKGVPVEKGKRGDLLVKLHIELPRRLSKTAAKIVEELKKEGV
ncbi:MAG: molecular chaperone DnaJ [Candidatus Taylorbacteria bacterium RIFCSPHIGHO2_01_FULL_45_63]|uniref:Chaperone protein DnaJ n=1 Tax=Candidatus Taylorbacteria bacterium RIFCSPHIGHO2_02_FULL_45_35 TaxID=1802311 RepID=A0A1G2MT99_9BACT|nr:MAG: molecular chaperone DnaJ [Candidatus Taylorbacteria bacterium RIFCSPHIGHO2_01_FULL_45_63]OHA26221.1 MAG: molecular chaperone DnaJ [Candidatus Taylorbacteria bacterium RIFCSPHIGHO2_02_FULL_45_35]OHA32561.1 MAG: molecular chaperone DnaJ [Candidatus Taylorbacteria bacterium RIFCSPLOWO2_01_FULL_45_34b]